MGRPLDFIIFGVPRSGTTALGYYLSASREIHCFLEILRTSDNHSGVIAPETFLRFRSHWRKVARPKNGAPTRLEQEIAAKNGAIRRFGHKRPSYFHDLQRIVDQSRCTKALLCYRGIDSVMQSYSSRSRTETDKWHSGRVGMFAALETILMVHAVSRVRGLDVMVIPQKALMHNWRATTLAAGAFIDHALELSFDAPSLERVHNMKDRSRRRAAPVIEPVDQRLADIVKAVGIDEIFEREQPFPLVDVIDKVRGAAAMLPTNLLELAVENARTHPNPKAVDYCVRWSDLVRPGLQHLGFLEV